MKKLLFFLLLIMAVSCTSSEKGSKDSTYPYNVVVIDSCEYLCRRFNDAGYMAHKGNCKHCTEIRQREYDALIERIKEVIDCK